MKFVTFFHEGKEKIGVLSSDSKGVYSIESLGLSYNSMNDLIESMNDVDMKSLVEKLRLINEYSIEVESIQILAPIQYPKQDIICLGVNYLDHQSEANHSLKNADFKTNDPTIYFSKRVNKAIGHGGFIESHVDLVKDLDYEAELAVIIGKKAKNVKASSANEYIFGYTIINDVSARTIQLDHKQWYFGKSLDGFTSMGPCIATKEEFECPISRKLQCFVNGELRQNALTDKMIHGVADIIEELSRGMTLLPGTIIATGTPSGVGLSYTPPKLLKPGDVVECVIDGIGSLKNIVK